MATLLSTDVGPALSLTYGRALMPQFTRKHALLSLIRRILSTEKSVNWTVDLKNGVADAVAVAEDKRRAYSDSKKFLQKPCNLSFAYYDDVASISGRAAAISRGRTSVLGGAPNLHRKQLTDSVGRLGAGIATEIYSGDGTGPDGDQSIVGLGTIVASSGTYAGLNGSTYSEWTSTVDTIDWADITFDNLEDQLIRPIYDASGEEPEVIVTTSAIFQKIKSLYGSNTVPYAREISTAGRVVKLQSGVRAIEIAGGVPVIRDADCPANKIWGLNLNYLWLEQLDYAPESQQPEDQILMGLQSLRADPNSPLPKEILGELAGEIRNADGITPMIKKLGASGNSDDYITFADLQLACNKRNAQGVLTVENAP